MLPKSLLNLRLSDLDQLTHVSGGRPSQIDHDVGVDMRNLRITVPKSLQADLIDQTARTDSLDFLEDRASAGMVLEPRMLATAPAQVFLHDAMHNSLLPWFKPEGHGKGNISLLVERTGVVAEIHVFAVDGHPLAIVCQQLGRFENLGDEHRPLASWGRRKEVEVLPNCAANRAWDSDVVLESGQVAFDCLRYEFRHDSSALDPEPTIVHELEVARDVADDEAAKSLVTDEDVGSQTEDEVFDIEITGGCYGPCQIIGRCCIVKEIGGTADLERGVLSKRLVALEPLRV